MLNKKLTAIVFGFTILFPFPTFSEMLADIDTDVETEFGTYHPYQVNITTPSARTYTVESDFSNVSNFSNFTFTESDKSLLLQNYFVVKPSKAKQIYDIYNECKEVEIPIFVTTDSMLHTFHIFYDYMLRILEVEKFFIDLTNLSKACLEKAKEQYAVAVDTTIKEAARKNVAYFTVATKLLDDSVEVSTYVATMVQDELSLIANHQGFSPSPIFGYPEDYSQYVPRGHYTRNETLKKFFKSMMWYGRMMFRLKPTHPEEGERETLQAILIVKALNELSVNSEPALDVWNRIYNPTVFFVGKTDDLNIYDYTDLAEEVYGTNFASLSIDDFADETKLDSFITKGLELHNPLINSSWVEDWEKAQSVTPVTKGFRFMGQRFIPDSYMFQQLVYDEVTYYTGSRQPFTMSETDYGKIRGFPRGLDILAVLGSARAKNILIEQGDTEYTNYPEQMNKLKSEFSSLEPSIWAQNLYWNWLYSLMPLLFEKGEGFPIFMQNQAWQDKELSTALGSWAELRHDTILYAKQSYTIGITCLPPVPGLAYGYVEPNPWLYARLSALAKLMRVGLDSRGLLLDEFKTKLTDFESLLLSLKLIAEKELTNQVLSLDEYKLICNIGDTLEYLVTFPPEIAGQIESDTDDEMAVVADVHTDLNTSQCLEEGVGYPLNIFVIVEVAGEIKVTQGAIFSYYEFKQPMANRLTDEQWQEMLKGIDPPDLPAWMASFTDLNQSFVNSSPEHSFSKGLTVENRPPVADAGSDRTVVISSKVTLDGSGSSDPDGNTLSFCWQQAPGAGYPVVLSDTSTVKPSFVAKKAGIYVFQLTVSDGEFDSEFDTVTIRVNYPPIAKIDITSYPLTIGSKWEYDYFGCVYTAKSTGTVVEEVTGTKEIGEKRCYEIHSVGERYWADIQEIDGGEKYKYVGLEDNKLRHYATDSIETGMPILAPKSKTIVINRDPPKSCIYYEKKSRDTSPTQVKIFDIWGNKVKTIQNEDGSFFTWDGTNEDGELVSSGIYLYFLRDTGGNTKTGKIAVLAGYASGSGSPSGYFEHDPPRVLLDFPLEVGKEWLRISHPELGDVYSKVVGYERVTVPAGTFDCVEIRSDWFGHTVAYEWYGNIGLIQRYVDFGLLQVTGPEETVYSVFAGFDDYALTSYFSPQTQTIDPSVETTIVQNLTSGELKIDISTETFSENVDLTVSEVIGADIPPAVTTPDFSPTNIAIEIELSDLMVQVNKPIKITISYANEEISGINENNLRICRYDTTDQEWKEIEKSQPDPAHKRVIGWTSHLSYFQIMGVAPAKTLDDVYVYPNPFRPGDEQIIFKNLTAQATIKIFNIAGELVATVEETDGDGEARWQATNDSREELASGIYIYLVTNPDGDKSRGKIAIIR